MSRLRRSVLPLACVLLAAPLARAGDPPPTPAVEVDEGARAEATKLQREGTLLLDAGDLPGALAKFRAAYAIVPSPKILVNIGTTLTRMGRTAEAANVYQAYLEATGSEATRIVQVKNVLAALDPDLGKLAIWIEPGDAEVRVNDGEWLQPSPSHTVRVVPGPYVVRARRGELTAESRGKIARGEAQNVALTLSDKAPAQVPNAPAPWPRATVAPEPRPSVAGGVEGADSMPHGSPGHGRRSAALIAGGAGVAALAAGVLVGLQARSTWQDAHDMCPEGCGGAEFDAADALVDDARARAGMASVLVGAGGVAIAAGAFLWFTAPRAAPRATHLDAALGPGHVGFALSGSF